MDKVDNDVSIKWKNSREIRLLIGGMEGLCIWVSTQILEFLLLFCFLIKFKNLGMFQDLAPQKLGFSH